jgi:four helix bundle protein
MNEEQFKQRTKTLGLRTIRLCRELPKDWIAQTIERQLIRCGTSVGANYRAACRARSIRDIIAKLKIVEEELDETAYWLEMLIESDILPARKLRSLLDEANEILAMVVASIKTLRNRPPDDRSKSQIVNRKS